MADTEQEVGLGDQLLNFVMQKVGETLTSGGPTPATSESASRQSAKASQRGAKTASAKPARASNASNRGAQTAEVLSAGPTAARKKEKKRTGLMTVPSEEEMQVMREIIRQSQLR